MLGGDILTGITELIQDMILDDKGNKIVVDNKVLPLDILMECVTQISERLGK